MDRGQAVVKDSEASPFFQLLDVARICSKLVQQAVITPTVKGPRRFGVTPLLLA